MQTFSGYHGTSYEAAMSILGSTFNESKSKTEWLGHGVYFFVDGVSDPVTNAKDWARAQAWDIASRSNKYEKFSVLETNVQIGIDKLIDLCDLNGLKNFNALKEIWFDKIAANFDIKKPLEHSCAMFNCLVSMTGAHAVRHNLYIKSIRERKLKLQLNVPNTTVLCVSKDVPFLDVTEIFVGATYE
ncbi:hypothetical protein [Glaciimonas soli]|uniref:Uncharacterized protein n=1 Tax=Glaciimonas soli TaxID=2590999 RepID=A0A843YPA0_9BURK|nr:hypothetical protein [Glaciimonas soli]MQR01649.1 hypothetical protein [Glaciimonas soli]